MSGLTRHPETRAALLGGFPLSEVFRLQRSHGPVYVYDLDGMERGARDLAEALGPNGLVAYAAKANCAGSILRRLAGVGIGADVVSGAELELARRSGVPTEKIVMSGVAKSDAEIDLALARGIRSLQVESIEELKRIEARARAQAVRARVSLRLNPNVNIDSHAHIATGHDAAKFGVAREAWPVAAALALESDSLAMVGVSVHVGSMLRKIEPYLAAARVVCEVARDWLGLGLPIELVDFGGGFGIDYGSGEVPPAPREFALRSRELQAQAGLSGLQLIVEPGRSLVGAYGALVTSVIQSKVSSTHRWVMIDAGMNDLIRPALYGAHHRIEPLDRTPSGPSWRVVGPVCESSDDFGQHDLGDSPPAAVVIRDVGAYGFTLASEYNGRALPAELFVSAGKLVGTSPSPGTEAWIERRLRA
ncbi:MAG: diaminopimelate decarboxylase [Deltaproteobacteria bacterium]